MEIIDCIQGSEEWFAARCGVPSASNFDKIVTSKGEPSTQAKKYMYKLAGESVSGIAEETYKNAAMERGTILEDEARQLYQIINDEEVKQVGFCKEEGYGCSPDGMVLFQGMLEIKCPSAAVHVEYLLKETLPTTYIQQVQGQMLVTGSKWCDFMSYYPGIKPFIIRVERDEPFISKLKSELDKFCAELKSVIERIK